MTRRQALTDKQWARIEPLLPNSKGKQSRPFRDHRQVVNGIIYRYRTGCPWRDLPAEFGPWQTVWKRQARFSRDGTWDRVLEQLLAAADAAGEIDWQLAMDSNDQPGPPARRVVVAGGRRQPALAHGGRRRIARDTPSSRLITRSVVLGVG